MPPMTSRNRAITPHTRLIASSRRRACPCSDTCACPWRIRKLCCDRHLEQTAAMVPPCVAVKDGRGGRRLARSFSRRTAIERLVSAMLVVIIVVAGGLISYGADNVDHLWRAASYVDRILK